MEPATHLRTKAAFSADWWRGREFAGFLADLIAGELGRLRPHVHFAPWLWAPETTIESLGIDSLDGLRLATAVVTALQPFPTRRGVSADAHFAREDITDAPDALDQLGRIARLDFASEARDVAVEHALFRGPIPAP